LGLQQKSLKTAQRATLWESPHGGDEAEDLGDGVGGSGEGAVDGPELVGALAAAEVAQPHVAWVGGRWVRDRLPQGA